MKPFYARELLARIGAGFKPAELRRESAADLKHMQRLLEVGARCVRGSAFKECLEEIVGAAIDILGADKGIIQLRDPRSGKLIIAGQKGFGEPFLSAFAKFHEQEPLAWGKELDLYNRVIVEDVNVSEIFAHSPALDLLLAAGVRAMQSTPLVGSTGQVSGMISTYFGQPHQPAARELRMLDLLARQAADCVERKQDELLRERTEMSALGQSRVLEMVATGKPLQETLDSLLLFIEGQEPNFVCGFLLTDDCVHFRPGSGPSIPAAYKSALYEAIKSAPNTRPYLFPCCNAAQWGKVVLVSDVAQESNYARAWRELMLASGFRAIRVTPVHASNGHVIGCFAVYFFEPRSANPADDQLIATATRLACIAIEREKAETVRAILLGELNHRIKNTLASVQAIAQQTLRNTSNPADFTETFSGRIRSLARAHSLLTDSTWRGADLRELIRDQLLQGSVDETKLTISGPAIYLDPQVAVHVALMLHELGTNCVKYGSLLTPEGTITIKWAITDNTLILEWIERGGCIVVAPRKSGFGTALIEHSAKAAGGEAHMLCEQEGITWTISVALSHSTADEVPRESAPKIRTPEATAGERALPLSGLRLLIVEDEPLIGLELAERLEQAGCHVLSPIGTEVDALRLIEGEQFDGALLDANLHGRPVNGIAAALTRRKVPFVFVTGYGRAGLPGGYDQVPLLSKPISDQRLFDAVLTAVSGNDTAVGAKI
jgi:two-component sensor histidine kinase/CheY-like chemotaxis protein